MNLFDFDTEDLKCIMPASCFIGGSVRVDHASDINHPKDHSVIYVKKEKWKEEYKNPLLEIKESLIILDSNMDLDVDALSQNNHVLISENSRLDFAKVIGIILKKDDKQKKYQTLDNNIVIGENSVLGENVVLEPFTFVDCDVVIGRNCIIKAGAKIRSNVTIGDNVIIGENTVLGAQGFGIEMDKSGRAYRIPHIGGVIIGDNVEIGALSSIVSGTISPTVVSNNVMIDDLVHIAHNCAIGESTMITACAQISGSAIIGENCYFAPNSTVRNGTRVGKDSFIGQASSVTKDLENNSVVSGNPAMKLERLKKMRKLINKMIDEREGDLE